MSRRPRNAKQHKLILLLRRNKRQIYDELSKLDPDLAELRTSNDSQTSKRLLRAMKRRLRWVGQNIEAFEEVIEDVIKEMGDG